ncbi:glycosyltransferase family 2 protein [Vibrio sp. M260118]|uniref:glycosyltransferase family 2 protein n=1 Tax=Vibrio sp. M260118 TaxID=3020896 RepID=UPI002F41167D
MNNVPKLAIVIPCYNEDLIIDKTVFELCRYMSEIVDRKIVSTDSYIVFVDDGSQDETWKKIKAANQKYENVRGFKLSKNQGHQIALWAGMIKVKDDCDCVISLDADLQQDINAIEKFIEKYKNGVEVVYGVRNDRSTDGKFKKYSATLFYKLMSVMGVDIIKNHADYRLLSNRANLALLEYKEVNLFLRGMVNLIGFETDTVYFDVKIREAGESKYTLTKMLGFALEGITSFSVVPLRMISFLGGLSFIGSFVMTIYILLVYLFSSAAVPGWASTVLPIYFIGGIQIFSIGIVGEYVGKIYTETKHRPKYFIREEL